MVKRSDDKVSRTAQEQGEGKSVVKVDVSDARMQETQQVSDASKDASTKPVQEESPYAKKKQKSASSMVKQDVAAQVVAGAAASGPIGSDSSGASMRMLSGVRFSGNEGTIAGSTASTPVVGQGTRPVDRFGKKTESITKYIDYMPSEQIVTESDGSKPLAQQKDEVQGYNGTIRNENALSQKNQGHVPGSLNFQRSLDEIAIDQLYWARGQVIKQASETYHDTPTRTLFTKAWHGFSAGTTPAYDKDGNAVDPSVLAKMTSAADYQGFYVDLDVTRGNYLPRALHVHVTNGKIDQFYFDVLDVSTTVGSSEVVNASATHELMHINRCELARQRIDKDAGDEMTSKYWSPLPRAISQPSQSLCFLDDMDAMIGDEIFISYKKLTSALAYQLNLTAKTGMHPSRAMRQALIGCILPEHNSAIYADDAVGDVFDKKWYKLGAASLMLAINDSTPKYNTIGKLLSLPLGPKSYLQVADNNMNAFKVDSNFAGIVNSKELFSTIDHEYDGVSPLFMTDKSAVVYPYDWNDLYAFKSLDLDGNPVLEKPAFSYAYSDVRSNYTMTVTFPLLKGIVQFLQSRMDKLVSKSCFDATTFGFVIPVIHSTKYISAWDELICGATKFIQLIRTNSLLDLIRLEENYGYPFTELTSLLNANPMNNANYANHDYQTPLQAKTMLPSAAIGVLWPEVMTPVSESGSKEYYLLPWYFNEQEFTFVAGGDDQNEADQTTIQKDYNAYCMSYPTIRSGVRLSYADVLFSMSERDIRLCLDRIVDITGGQTLTGACVYKYDPVSDGIPVISGDALGMTLQAWIALPRELGLSMVPPAGLLTPQYFGVDNDEYEDITHDIVEELAKSAPDLSQYLLDPTASLTRKWFPCHRLTYFFASDGRDPMAAMTGNGLFSPEQINVSRSTSFSQNWNSYPALPGYCKLATDPGFRLSVGESFEKGDVVRESVAKMVPYCIPNANGDLEVAESSAIYTISLQKSLWTRIQRLPFAISPWDVAAGGKVALFEDGLHTDVFDVLYLFGFCGMRASDYREDLYNKENAIMNLGLNYIQDKFIEDSPVMKDAMRYTSIGH